MRQTNNPELNDLLFQLLQHLEPHEISAALSKRLPPAETCEVCKRSIPVRDMGINVVYAVNGFVGSPGHPGLPPFGCPQGQHWVCSPDCYKEMAVKCMHEHIHPILDAIHKNHLGRGNNGNESH